MTSTQQFEHSEFGYEDEAFNDALLLSQVVQFVSTQTPDTSMEPSDQPNLPLGIDNVKFNLETVSGRSNVDIDIFFPPTIPHDRFESASSTLVAESSRLPYILDSVSGATFGPRIVALDDSELHYRREGSTMNSNSTSDSLFLPQSMEPQSGRMPRAYNTDHKKLADTG